MKKILLIVDPQIDFCDSKKGSLYVKGAEEKMSALGEWIKKENPDHIFITLDSHYPGHISFKNTWINKKGDKPSIFSTIKPKEEGWTTYLTDTPPAEIQIWPEHCILGTEGWCIFQPLYETIKKWCLSNKTTWTPLRKGMEERYEEYGAFNQQGNRNIAKTFFNRADLFVGGVAGDYCVKECIEQLKELGLTPIPLKECIAWIGDEQEI